MSQDTFKETQEFVCIDPSGNVVIVVAERENISEELGQWKFRTKDGRHVKRPSEFRRYVIEPDNIELTTTDPREPLG